MPDQTHYNPDDEAEVDLVTASPDVMYNKLRISVDEAIRKAFDVKKKNNTVGDHRIRASGHVVAAVPVVDHRGAQDLRYAKMASTRLPGW